MNIILFELKSNFKGLIIWTVSLSVIFLAASTEFEGFQGNQDIIDAMASFEQLFAMLGSSPANMTTATGFLSLVSIYIYLPLAIYSGLLGSNIISKEEKNRTAEYLFTLPVKREKVLISKLVVALFYSVVINIFVMAINLYAFGRFGMDYELIEFILYLSVGVLFTQLIFLSLGMILSSVLKQYKKSGSVTVSILITTFFLSILSGLTEETEFFKYFTPFKYFAVDKVTNGEFELIYIFLSLVIVVGSIYGMFYFYKKRDLYI